jgi:hypothetical protein
LGVTGTYHGRQMAQSERERMAKLNR